jgi:hypothetical protein
MQDDEPTAPRPEPALGPQPITLDQFDVFTPEKFELWQGYLFMPPEYTEDRRNLLLLLLTNEGLLEAVRLAPPERWREALRQVYGEA